MNPVKGLLIFFVPAMLGAQTPSSGIIIGRVTSRPDSSPIPGAAVGVSGSAVRTTTDSAGRFALINVPAGRATIHIQRLGYRSLDRVVGVAPNDTLRVSIVLETEAQQLAPVRTDVARTEVESFTARPNVGTIAMPARLMAGVPAIGEPDVARVVQLLAGVSARNDYNTGLNVRGGSADQNLVLLDGIPIYNPFHMGGLFSTFMDATVGGIELMTGAFPARYDGRLSSVLDVHSADETRAGIHGTTDVSVLATSARLAGALGSGRGNWSFAARRTYADAVAAAFSRDNFPYHFVDLEGHVAYTLPNAWRVAVTGYAGKDLLDLNLASLVNDSSFSSAGQGGWQYDWGNRVVGATLSKDFTSRISFEQRVSTSAFSTRLDIGEGAETQRSDVRDVRVNGSLAMRTSANDWSLGYEVASTHVGYSSSSAETGTSAFDIVQDPMSYAAWLDDIWRVSYRWVIEGGLRGDALSGGRDWAALSPRLSVKYFATPTIALTAAAGRVTQNMHSLAGDGPFRFFDIWLASDQYIPVETAWHWVAGVERRLETTSIKIEGYVKKYDRVLDANPYEDPTVRGDEFFAATGLTYGVDLLARWQPARGPTGWLSYSYGVASHERDGVRWAPGNDRRHDVNAVATWRLAHYRIGARLGYATGTPYTPIVGQIARRVYDPANDTWGTGNPPIYLEPLGGARNSARFPATQRLDLDVSREMTVRGATVAPYVSVVNAYNARNVFVYFYDYATASPTRRGYTQFPILPSVGVRVAF
ncbi:MAG TPA: TonB-dependent receptor [Gemmatimonadaceae bacterium]